MDLKYLYNREGIKGLKKLAILASLAFLLGNLIFLLYIISYIVDHLKETTLSYSKKGLLSPTKL